MLELHLAPGSSSAVAFFLTAALALSCGLLTKSVLWMMLVPRLARNRRDNQLAGGNRRMSVRNNFRCETAEDQPYRAHLSAAAVPGEIDLQTAMMRLEQFGKLLAVGLAAVQLFAWQLYFYSTSHDTVDGVWIAAGIGVCLLLAKALEFVLRHRSAQAARATLVTVAVLQVVGFGIVNRLFAHNEPVLSRLIDVPGTLKVNATNFALTDKGSRIALFDRELNQTEFYSYVHSTRANMLRLSERAILRAGPLANTNCHGWVFAAGQYIVRNEDVQTILDENNYQEVTQPAINDLVVYRDQEGGIIHTAVLCGFIDGDTPLVEGKWGVEGTYVHAAADQPYSQDFSFYCTARPSHTLRIYTGSGNIEPPAEQIATLPSNSRPDLARS